MDEKGIFIVKKSLFCYIWPKRGVAQPGRASALGAECRQFESGYPDTKRPPTRGFGV